MADLEYFAKLRRVKTEDLKKRKRYLLTFDFYEYGGKEVHLLRHEKASLHAKGWRGDVAILQSTDGCEIVLGPGTWIWEAP